MLLDAHLVAERRLALGLSRPELARHISKSPPVVDRLEQGENHETLTVGLVAALASALAVQPSDLFLVRAPHAPGADDVRVEAALAMVDKGLSTRELAAGLNWSGDRVLAALDALRERLASTGVNRHLHAGRWHLRARIAVLSREEQRAVEQARVAKARLSLYDARVLADVLAGKVTARWVADASNAQQVSLATLVRLGYTEPHGGGHRLAGTVRYSLGLNQSEAFP